MKMLIWIGKYTQKDRIRNDENNLKIGVSRVNHIVGKWRKKST